MNIKNRLYGIASSSHPLCPVTRDEGFITPVYRVPKLSACAEQPCYTSLPCDPWFAGRWAPNRQLRFQVKLKMLCVSVTNIVGNTGANRSRWQRGLRRRSAAARLLRLWVLIPLGTWMFVCCEWCESSNRDLSDELIIRTEQSYWAWCVVVCDLETSRMVKLWKALGRSAGGRGEIFEKEVLEVECLLDAAV
jgi:hypothetical protein